MNRLIRRRNLIGLMVAGLVALPGASATPLPVEMFFKHFDFQQMSLSHDGKFLVAVAPYKGRKNLFSIELATKKSRLLTDLGDRDVADYAWANNERLVLEIEEDGFLTGGLYAVNRDGSRALTLFPSMTAQVRDGYFVARAVDVLDLLDDPNEILVSRTEYSANQEEENKFFPDVYRVNIYTGSKRLELKNPGNVLGWITDQAGAVRIGLVQDKLQTRILHRRDGKAPWETLVEYDMREDGIAPVAFGTDPNQMYVSAYRGDTRALYAYDVGKRALGDLVFAHDQVDTPDGSLVFGSKTKQLLGVPFAAERRQVYWINEVYQKWQQFIDQQMPGTANHIVDVNEDLSLALVFATSDRNPGAYYLLHAPELKLEKLVEVAGHIDPAQMSPMKPIQYRARDGLVIHGFLTLPRGAPGKLPLVVNPHGGPFARDYWEFNREAQFLANRGYAVLQINFRGSTGYGKRLYHAGFKEWGGKMQDDITDGVRWAIAEGVADPKSIAIYGASYGGYAAMAGLAFTPELYRCGINYVGVTDLPLLLKTYPLSKQFARHIDSVMIGDLKKEKDLLRERSPINFVERIQAPVLLAYGMKDQRVVVDHGKKLAAALRRHGKKFEMITKPDEGHGFRIQENVFEFYRKMDEFLDAHLKSQ